MILSSEIKQLIAFRFGREIEYSKDCEALARSIYNHSNERVGITTLKRLYGFAKEIGEPRLSTLNVIASYVGVSDWESLKSGAGLRLQIDRTNLILMKEQPGQAWNEFIDIFQLNQELNYSLQTGNIDTNKVVRLCDEFGVYPQIFPFLIGMVQLASNEKNHSFFTILFELPNVFDQKKHSPYNMYYLGQSIGMAFRKDRQLTNAVMNEILDNNNARSFVVEWFVDEDFLDGYYGEMILTLGQKRVDKFLKLFIHIMLNKRALMMKDMKEAEKMFKKIRHAKIEDDIHEILMGRYLAVQFLNVENRKDYLELIDTVNSFIRKRDLRHVIAFVFCLCKELILHEREKTFQEIMKIMDQFLSNQKMPELFHWEKRVLNGIDLLKCRYLLGCKKKQEAKELYLKVDPRKFEIFHLSQMQKVYEREHEEVMR